MAEGEDERDRRYARSYQGLLNFCMENTKAEDAVGSESTDFNRMSEEAEKSRMLIKTQEGMPNSQEMELAKYGKYRYRIPGDGNCMFRAIAFGMKLDQETSHPVLREAAVGYMKEHVDELKDPHVIDNIQEIDEVQKDGTWPGQAALIPLSNVLGVNIAVFFSGDKGPIDIQYFRPYSETSCDTIYLLYSFDGHYDAVVDKPNMLNPEYDLWVKLKTQQTEESVSLAKELEEKEFEKGHKEELHGNPSVESNEDNLFPNGKPHRKYVPVTKSPTYPVKCVNNTVTNISAENLRKIEHKCSDTVNKGLDAHHRKTIEIPVIKEKSVEKADFHRKSFRNKIVLTPRPLDQFEPSFGVGFRPASPPRLCWKSLAGYV